jgi:quercetin dioxygenase-like cupin family protein
MSIARRQGRITLLIPSGTLMMPHDVDYAANRITGGAVGTYRMYTDAQGKARWEDVDLAKMPEWTSGLDVTNIRFGIRPPGVLQDWHPAPQRQFVFIISGGLEIGFEDGSKKVFGPGDIRLVEDTTGKGHTTIAAGNEACVTATVGLKDQR